MGDVPMAFVIVDEQVVSDQSSNGRAVPAQKPQKEQQLEAKQIVPLPIEIHG